jgi:hypothetical protein
VTFSLANEYTIAKNTEVGFAVLADIPTVAGDAAKTVRLSFYQSGTTTALSHLLAVGQSSGTQLTANNAATSVLSNAVTITASGAQDVVITEDSDWDVAAGNVIAAGSGRVVGNWKIADSTLSENAEITELVMTNTVGAGVTPETYHFSNFELYHDGVKVATAATMAANGTVTFGDGETTIFTVTDGDTAGKTLVVKADISSDVTKNDELDLQITATDVTGKGASTGQPIDATGTAIDLTNNKVLKQTYATITKEEGVATSVAAGTSTELLRFTVTPEAGEVLNLSDLSFVIKDLLGTTAGEALTVYDVTNSSNVTLAGVVTITNVAPATGEATITFADATYAAKDAPITFSVRANTTAILPVGGNGSYQIGIKYDGDMLQVTAATQDATAKGFAPLGDKIVGPTVTATK